jgi:WD40 repeat protein
MNATASKGQGWSGCRRHSVAVSGSQALLPLRGRKRWLPLVLTFSVCMLSGTGLLRVQADPAPEPFYFRDFLHSTVDMAFQPDGKALVIAGHVSAEEDKLLVFDYPGGRLRRIMAMSSRDIWCIGYSPDGSRLAAGCYNAVLLWEPNAGRLVAEVDGHHWPVCSLCFSEDGKTLVTAGSDNQLKVWDGLTGAPRANFQFPEAPFSNRPAEMAVSPRDRAPLLHQFNLPMDTFGTAVLLPDGKTVAVATGDKNVLLWDTSTGKQMRNLKTDHSEAVGNIALSRDGRILATGGLDGTVRLWDTRTFKRRGVFTTPANNFIKGIFFSPDGKTLAAHGLGGVTVWDLDKGSVRFTIHSAGMESLTHCAISPDWKTIATIMSFRTERLCFWDMARGKEVFPARR